MSTHVTSPEFVASHIEASAPNREAHSSGVSWGAVIGGAFVAAAGIMAVAAFAGVGLLAAIAVQTLLPSFSANYWSRIIGSVQYIAYSPNGVLSGRLTNWMFLGDFLWRQPWTAAFGIVGGTA